MLMPSIFGDVFMDDFFGFPQERKETNTSKTVGLMQTDVKESKDHYEVVINLPGYNKDDVNAELKDGYLIISASTDTNNEEKDNEGRYIRRERYSGSCSRSFYVGEAVTQDEIKASYTNGVLHLSIPKKEDKAAVERKNYISIEG